MLHFDKELILYREKLQGGTMLKDISNIKKFFVICVPVIVLVVGITVIKSFSQTKQVEKREHKIVINPHTPVEGIQSGYVIAYGHYLESPYEVKISDGKIYINGVQMYMPKPPKPIQMSVDRLGDYEQAQEMDSLIISKYKEWKQEYGVVKAQELITEFLEKHASVKDAKIENDILYVIYKNGLRTNLLLGTAREAKQQKNASGEKELRLENRANRIINSLQKGSLVMFGYGYCRTEPRGKDLFLKVKEIMDKNTTISQKKNLLQNFIKDPGMLNEVLYNF